MTLEDLQERLKSEWQQTVDRLNENPLFINLKDRYESLSTTGQKLVLFGGVFVLLLIVGMYPYNSYMTSADTMQEFEGKRSLIRDLLRTYKEAAENRSAVVPPMPQDVRSRVEGILGAAQLLPEQNKGVIIAGKPGSLVRESLVGGVVQVSLAQLNLKQITSLGTEFSSIQGAKLKDVLMDASSKDPRYYDVVFRILVFKSEGAEESGEEPPAPVPGRGRR